MALAGAVTTREADGTFRVVVDRCPDYYLQGRGPDEPAALKDFAATVHFMHLAWGRSVTGPH